VVPGKFFSFFLSVLRTTEGLGGGCRGFDLDSGREGGRAISEWLFRNES
jgi:hypothetical protein